MTAGLTVLLAVPAAAERSLAVRIHVQAAGGGAHGAADSVADVRRELGSHPPYPLLALADSREDADLVLEVMGR
jgi:hypothetical protein